MDLTDEKKIRWMCRRGLLELDIILTQILEHKYPSLTARQKALFIELLSEADTDLLAWLLQQNPLPDHWSPEKITLVEALKQTRIQI